MATKTVPAPELPDDELTRAYAQARAELDDAKRHVAGHEPITEDVEEDRGDMIAVFRRTLPSPIAAAQAKVHTAERALRSAHGQGAVDVAEAKARHHTAAMAVRRAEEAGLGGRAGGDLARLIGAEEAAARHVAVVERMAALKAQAYAQRCALDGKHADVIKQASAELEASRHELTNAAAAAERALLALVAATDAYKATHVSVTGRLVALGFTDGTRHDGTAYDTQAGAVLAVGGRTWLRAEAAELLPRALSRVAEAIGERVLRDRLMQVCGLRRHAADVLLADVPELARVDRQQPPKPAALGLWDIFERPAPAKADRDYIKDVPRKRRVTFKAPPAA